MKTSDQAHQQRIAKLCQEADYSVILNRPQTLRQVWTALGTVGITIADADSLMDLIGPMRTEYVCRTAARSPEPIRALIFRRYAQRERETVLALDEERARKADHQVRVAVGRVVRRYGGPNADIAPDLMDYDMDCKITANVARTAALTAIPQGWR